MAGIGKLLNYILLERVGHGASCKVFLAQHESTHQQVAIKVPKAGVENRKFLEFTRAEV